jgi:hypothetical protein
MKKLPVNYLTILLSISLALLPVRSQALQNQVSREQDIVNLQLGQRVKVDDGTCPSGQIKQIMGARMSASGVVRTHKCIPRPGSKK